MVEIFAGTGRVTACLKQLGMSSSFGTDCVRHKQAMAQIVVADLTTEAGIELLMQWLSNPYVVGIFSCASMWFRQQSEKHTVEA